jgi:Gas vesicle protein K
MRIEPDQEDVARGLAQLVPTVIKLLRQLMERQAIRRVEAGGLSDDEIERLGRALIALEQRMDELKEDFGLTDEELNFNLGPLGNLL